MQYKNHLLTLIAITCFILPVRAQRPNEITLSIGLWSNYRLNELSEAGPFNTTGAHYSRTDIKDPAAYFLTYHHKLSKVFIIGFSIGAEHETGSFSDNSPSNSGQYEKKAITLGIEGKYLYHTGGGVRLYGFAALGTRFEKQHFAYSALNPYAASANSEDLNAIAFTYQLTPIGVRIGRQIGGFAELGYGYKGILNLGLSCRF